MLTLGKDTLLGLLIYINIRLPMETEGIDLIFPIDDRTYMYQVFVIKRQRTIFFKQRIYYHTLLGCLYSHYALLKSQNEQQCSNKDFLGVKRTFTKKDKISSILQKWPLIFIHLFAY